MLLLPDWPLFFKAAATARSTLFIQGCFPFQSTFFLKIVTSATSTIIPQGIILWWVWQELLLLPDPLLFLNAASHANLYLFLKADSTVRSTLIPQGTCHARSIFIHKGWKRVNKDNNRLISQRECLECSMEKCVYQHHPFIQTNAKEEGKLHLIDWLKE